ncbi:MAG: hypothetical protein GY821_09050, partial [Gammaproteobacteria bacterium]|nr:hypothetical protein [Gammaproteobacteria bacterium]
MGETHKDFADRLRRCFQITDEAQQDQLDKEFYRLDRGWEASVAPIAVSFLEADKLPDETSRLHLTNIKVMRHYLEDMMMKLPQQQVMNKRGQFVLPEDELKYWEEHLREYYVASQIPTMSTMDINVWES